MNWEAFLRIMIEDEKAAINKYRLAIEQAESKSLRDALKRLMDEEGVHIDILEHEISKLKAV